MTAKTSVIGLMVAKNEWPLCALSVSHLLGGHVDSLWIADHASNDESRVGLEMLRELWGTKLHILRIDEADFWQEAITGILLEMSEATDHDWIYVVDLDEFILPPKGLFLPQVLDALSEDTNVVRYQVENWVSTRSFDEASLDSYLSLINRAVTRLDSADNPLMLMEQIREGTLNYFDAPFTSKILFRRRAGAWVSSGTHSLKDSQGYEAVFEVGELRAAHLPLLTKERLRARVERGLFYSRAGYPKVHGWQSQMVYDLSLQGDLDEFWRRHSLDIGHRDDPCQTLAGGPTVSKDDALLIALEPTIEVLRAFCGKGSPSECCRLST